MKINTIGSSTDGKNTILQVVDFVGFVPIVPKFPRRNAIDPKPRPVKSVYRGSELLGFTTTYTLIVFI